ncbi:MAG: hypothetical protein WD738_21365 [Pirellulales bacterium]
MTKKPRLYSKREPRLPVPSYRRRKSDKGFALRTLESADQRFAIVKELRRRLEQLREDAGCTTIQRDWLAARAVFVVARLESLEYDAVTGKKINWAEYCRATKVLSDLLRRLGLDPERKTTKRLRDYVLDAKKSKNGSNHD